MTARYHPSTCGRWIIEVIPDDPHGEARILSLEDASDRLAMHKRLQMDFLQSDAMATRVAPAATRQRRSRVDPGHAARRDPSTWEGGMNRMYDHYWQADQRRRAAQRYAARSGNPLQIIDARSWGQGASIALQAAAVALIFGVFLYCIGAI